MNGDIDTAELTRRLDALERLRVAYSQADRALDGILDKMNDLVEGDFHFVLPRDDEDNVTHFLFSPNDSPEIGAAKMDFNEAVDVYKAADAAFSDDASEEWVELDDLARALGVCWGEVALFRQDTSPGPGYIRVEFRGETYYYLQ